MMKGFSFDPMTQELVMTTAAANKAGKLGTPEYNTLKKLRTDYPGIIITVKSKAKNTNGLNFAHMESIIRQCRDAEKRITIFDRVKNISKGQDCPYQYVKEWFLTNYANFDALPTFDADGFLIIKTKAEMEAEAKPEKLVESQKKTA